MAGRILWLLLVVCLWSGIAIARAKVQGIASTGGTVIVTVGLNSTTKSITSFPSCTVTVFLAGTTTPASIFSDNVGTAKANPFTANSDASWSFFVDDGHYDVKFSGTGIVTPFTLSDIVVVESGQASLKQGTAPIVTASTIQLQAPASVTGYNLVYPGAAPTVPSILQWNNVSNVVTATFTNTEILLSTTTGVDMNTATATTLYTCPSSKTCVITRVAVSTASTSLTTASWSYGWNSATFNDVVANATHVELTGATLYSILGAKVGATLGTSTGVFKVLMNTLQGGAATTRMDVFGYVY